MAAPLLAAGPGLAIVAFFGGMMPPAIYLLVLSFQTQNGVAELLLGKKRAASRARA
jgi:hypothetical protein